MRGGGRASVSLVTASRTVFLPCDLPEELCGAFPSVSGEGCTGDFVLPQILQGRPPLGLGKKGPVGPDLIIGTWDTRTKAATDAGEEDMAAFLQPPRRGEDL